MKAVIGYIVLISVVLALCGMAMHVTALDNECSDAGGRLGGWRGQTCASP